MEKFSQLLQEFGAYIYIVFEAIHYLLQFILTRPRILQDEKRKIKLEKVCDELERANAVIDKLNKEQETKDKNYELRLKELEDIVKKQNETINTFIQNATPMVDNIAQINEKIGILISQDEKYVISGKAEDIARLDIK